MNRWWIGSLVLLVGCTSPSTKLAITTNDEIEQRQDRVFNQMAHNTKVYQYNELKSKIKSGQADDAFLSDFWNQRNGLEAYMIEWERIRTLKYVSVNPFLYAQQSQLDLHYKSMKDWLNANQAAVNEPTESK